MDQEPTNDSKDPLSNTNLALLMDVQLPVSIRFGETEMLLEDIVKLGVGSIIELNCGVDEPVELIVNGKSLARGEVVTVDGFYGVRITEITNVGERIGSIGG
jgi:Flagellar motor switch/type III secretory pathway protein